MNASFFLIAALVLGTAATAMCLRGLVRAALMMTLTWMSVAVFYLWAGEQFVAFGQAIVYVGAVSMVVLFAVLLTRDSPTNLVVSQKAGLAGPVIAAGVAGVPGLCVLRTSVPVQGQGGAAPSVREIGLRLAGPYLSAVLVLGVILTAALIGALLLASRTKESP